MSIFERYRQKRHQVALALRQFKRWHRALKLLQEMIWRWPRSAVIETFRAVAPRTVFRWGAPKGHFSLLDRVRAGDHPGCIICEDQGMPELPPDAVTFIDGLEHHLEQPMPIFWAQFKNARLAGPSLALLNERKELALESVYGRRRLASDPANNYIYLPPARVLAGNWVSIVSRWTPNDQPATYTHWLLDALPRLAVLDHLPGDTRIIVPEPLRDYQRQALDILGLLDRCRPTREKHLLVENYFFSSPTAMVACYDPYGQMFLRSKFLHAADASFKPPKRFFLHRGGYGRNPINESEVLAFFRRAGWDIVSPEKLTWRQQIKLFSEAEAIAGVSGSAFTNAIWSPPGCKLFMFMMDTWLDGWMEWIAAVGNLEFHYQICPTNPSFQPYICLERAGRLLQSAGLATNE